LKDRLGIADPTTVVLALILTCFGLFYAFDAGYARSISAGHGVIPPEFISQIVGLVIGLALFLALARFNIEHIRKYAISFAGFCFVLLLLAEFSPLKVAKSGAVRWLKFGPIEIQPAEVAKLGAILFMAFIFSKYKPWKLKKLKHSDPFLWMDKVGVPKLKRIMPVLIVAIACYLIDKEPDLGTAAVIVTVSFAIAFLGGADLRWLFIAALTLVLAGVYMVRSQPYRMERMMEHGSEWSAGNIDGPGFQQLQAQVSMAYGGLKGKGLGTGRAKLVIPAPTTDFVLATVGEETGFLGILIIYLLLAGLVLRLAQLGIASDDKFAALILFGIATWLAVQGAVNALQANDTLPSIGIPFPFLSSGGSSLSVLLLSIGVAQACLRKPPVPSEENLREAIVDDSRNRRRDRRSYLSRT